jgi:hypothetical protein
MKHVTILLLVSVAFLLIVSMGDQSKVARIAKAIARAEGWYASGSLSQRNNNPGNLTNLDGSFQVHSTPSEGWAALTAYVGRMISGKGLYPKGATILEVSRIYTATEQDYWAYNVASDLGVSVNTPLLEV